MVLRLLVLLLILILAGSVLAQDGGALPDTLWAIPCGPMVGTMMPGARVDVLDTVAGWAKVTVEGWVPVLTALRYLPVDTGAASESAGASVDEEFRQCEAITLKGTRCTRRAMKGSRYCWQHQNYGKREK